jgi:hypothetical protein
MSFRLAKYRRVLACSLLLLIVYGATAEAVHHHRHISPDRAGVVEIGDAGGSPSSNTGRSPHRECSMCQFQQQLFGGLVHAPLFARTSLAEFPFVPELTVFYPSTSTTPPSGRGPPLV